MGKRQRAREARQNRQTRQERQNTQERPTPPPTLKTELHGKTPGQISVLRALKSHNQVIITGPAGTGKTYMTAGHAALALKSGAIRKIILTRPNVPAGPELGHLPGTQDEKMAPWAAPVRDVLERFLGATRVAYALEHKHIEIIPLETMRGRSFDDAYIIADEAQNMTYEQLKMLVTRTGRGSKLVLDGDIDQTDLTYHSGLAPLLDVVTRHNVPVAHVRLSVEDIVRSDLVKAWVVAFGEYERSFNTQEFDERRVKVVGAVGIA